jgi:two-component system, chemotaxis family, chemotaxis protein CheY
VNDFTPPAEAYAFRTFMPRILIVDDSPTIRKMVRASLRTLDAFDFVEAASGLQAIEQVALGPVALMILDLNMPDLHGVDVLKFLRRHPSSREVPVVVLTTRGDDSSRDAAVAAGATQYMTKPFVPQALLDAARELLGGAAS